MRQARCAGCSFFSTIRALIFGSCLSPYRRQTFRSRLRRNLKATAHVAWQRVDLGPFDQPGEFQGRLDIGLHVRNAHRRVPILPATDISQMIDICLS